MLSVLYILTFISAVENFGINNCATFGNNCDAQFSTPCCNDTLVCKYIDGSYTCIKEAKLGSSCEDDADCVTIPHAICSENKCFCEVNTIETGASECSPVLGAHCWENDVCAPNGSECFENKCQCREGFVRHKDICVSILIRASCNDSFCSDIEFAKCSASGLCLCTSNTISINLKTCSPRLNFYCQDNEDCGIENSICINKTCKCRPKFVNHDDVACKLPFLNMQCKNGEMCNNFINNSTCSFRGKCECLDNHYPEGHRACIPGFGEYCQEQICAIEDSFCEDNVCKCRPNYVFRGSSCVPVYLPKKCQEHVDCFDILFSMCSEDKKCICRDNYVAKDDKCEPVINGFCNKEHKCAYNYLECVNDKCQCKTNYAYVSSMKKCLPVLLGKSCRIDSDCQFIPNSWCSIEKICICDEFHFAINSNQCVPGYNGFCSDNNQCKFANFQCVDNKCQCKRNYTLLSADRCLKTQSLFRCNDILECSDPWHARCSEEKKCVCAENNVGINKSVCLPFLDGKCWRNDQCLAENSECHDFRCKCKLGFTKVAINMCASIN